jgi:hypothetical protein
MLLLDERIRSDGAHACTWASCDDGRVQIRDDDGASGEVAVAVVDQVMRRYGRPLDDGIALDGESLACGRYTLRRLRHRAVVDAEGRDYLVWQRPDEEPLVCVAATATAALRFLMQRRSTGVISGI